jgi:diaminohydroxyphosphoribosylaminopyrimidine deaminase/5-amino-6-(5-phosphoribosylamino)uracil reductase
VEVVELAAAEGRPGVAGVLDLLGRRRMTNVLVEGGAALHGSLVDAGQVDEVHAFLAPRIVGGAGKSPVGGQGVERVAQALTLSEWRIQDVDGDYLLHGWRG